MRNPSLTFAWISWRQHHLGLLIAVGLLTLAAIDSMMSAPAQRTREQQQWVLILHFLTVVVAAVMGLVSIFTYGDYQADVMARASGFPTNRFRLPVRTAALVGWPVTYGAVLPAILWLVIAAFIFRPWQTPSNDAQRMPLWWPAALASAFVAWLQAIVWWPLGLRGLRIVFVLVVGALLTTLGAGAAQGNLSEGARIALFLAVAILGWMVSYQGVCRARRGDVPDWEGIYDPLTRLWPGRSRHRRGFRSGARAHAWLQWRIWGRSLPIVTTVAVLLVFGPLIVIFRTVTPLLLTFVLATPVFLAALAGGWLSGGKSPWAKDRAGFSTLVEIMPVTDADLARSTLKAAAISSLASWALVMLVAAAVMVENLLFVWYAGLGHANNRWLKDLFDEVELRPNAAVATTVACAIWLFVWTWKRTLNSYLLGLFGRVWVLAEIGLWAFLLLASNIFLFASRASSEIVVPCFLGLLVISRMSVAVCVLRDAKQRGLLDARTIARCVALWLVLAGAAIGPLIYVYSADFDKALLLSLGVLVAFPMVRLAALPLILRSARHR